MVVILIVSIPPIYIYTYIYTQLNMIIVATCICCLLEHHLVGRRLICFFMFGHDVTREAMLTRANTRTAWCPEF